MPGNEARALLIRVRASRVHREKTRRAELHKEKTRKSNVRNTAYIDKLIVLFDLRCAWKNFKHTLLYLDFINPYLLLVLNESIFYER